VSATADEKGEFRFSGVPPGRYLLTIYAAGPEEPYSTEIEMSSDREVRVNLAMSRKAPD